MNLIYKTVYKIDYDAETIEEIIPDNSFNDVALEMIENINNNVTTKEYTTISQATQVVSDVRNMITIVDETVDSEDMNVRVQAYMIDVARRLLEKEIVKQDQITPMGQNVKKGSLIQAVIREGNEYSYLLAKVEHTKFVDDVDFSLKTGFSSEQKRIWKTCVFECHINEDSVTIDSARIYLSSPAKYWANDFLELKQVSTDEENTRKAFRGIDGLLNRSIREKAPGDYTVIRNYFVGYMKKEQQLNYNEMIDNILTNYEPEQMTKEEVQDLKEKLLELPDKKKFERLFMVVPKEVKARVKKIYKVNDGIDIKIDGYVENIKNTISSFSDTNTGAKYIKIMTNNDEVYKYFE